MPLVFGYISPPTHKVNLILDKQQLKNDQKINEKVRVFFWVKRLLIGNGQEYGAAHRVTALALNWSKTTDMRNSAA